MRISNPLKIKRYTADPGNQFQMNYNTRPLLLTLVSVAIIAIFFNFGYNRTWMETRVVRGVSDFSDQLSFMDPEERRQIRGGPSYSVSMNIASSLKQAQKDTNALILMPPVEYMREIKFDFSPPEPIVFYYYTGLHSIGANNKGADKANLAIIFINNNLQLIELNDTTRKEILALYRKYKY